MKVAVALNTARDRIVLLATGPCGLVNGDDKTFDTIGH